ncbi:aminotransferase class I/II-fold pyridoxal phosphate-dependent enzyme [Streptomyces sp. SID3343]|nr:PLP-dependent aminotransferase family protein [Streptomyces sp. SID3343]MYV97860.1 aminotransferase class I/II-fold pyridoxal phosphate-dependent enzyme [Streptomyces sp. SID3343]
MGSPRRNERRSRAERLFDAVRELVETGDLLADTRLPSERTLGTALGLSRGTVASAYLALSRVGLIERRHGSGSYVRAGGLPTFSRWLREGAIVVDLAKSVVPDASLLPDLRLRVEDLLDARPQDGYGPTGDPRLRELIAAGALPPGFAADDVVVTAGAQQAIHLVADALLRPGDRVLVEETTYPGMLAAVRRFGAEAIPVSGDRHGFDPDALHAAIRRHRPAYVFLLPLHNPTGNVLSARRARAIADIAVAESVLLVEDRTLADLAEGPVPSTAGRAPGLTVCLGSLSKTVWGGLRVGWVAAPAHVRPLVAEAKQRTDLACSTLDQQLAVHILRDPTHRARVRAWSDTLARRRDHFAAALTEHLPEWEWTLPRGGLSVWVHLPNTDGEAFVATALRHGVAVSPGAVFSPTRSPAGNHIRLTYAWPEPVLTQATALLAKAWATHTP